MTIRVALSVALLTLAGTPAASAATSVTVMEGTFACPSMGVTNEHNAIWKKKGYDAAWVRAKPLGCRPMLATASKVIVIKGGDEAKCVVEYGENHPCLWLPASLLK